MNHDDEKKPEGMTHADRMADIDDMAELYCLRPCKTAEDRKKRRQFLQHIERLRLIYAPFPPVRRIGTGSAMPWAGTMVGDTFYGRNTKQFRPAGMTGGTGDEGVLTGYYERELELLDAIA